MRWQLPAKPMANIQMLLHQLQSNQPHTSHYQITHWQVPMNKPLSPPLHSHLQQALAEKHTQQAQLQRITQYL